MSQLNVNPTLKDIQTYVRQIEEERGFSDETVLQQCLLLGEEIGELFKAIRKTEHMKMDPHAEVLSVDKELADVLIYLASIANRHGIDLEQALRTKEEINKKRVWKAAS